MEIILKNNEDVIIKSDKHKILVTSDCVGKLIYDSQSDKIKIEDTLVEDQINVLMIKNQSWGMDRLEPTKKFILELVNNGSKALRVDRDKLCSLIIESCSYSAINYFQEGNFHKFKDVEELEKSISDLNMKIFELNKKHALEVIELQKKITETQNVVVKKEEVETNVDYDWDIWVNCPYCDDYQKIKEYGDWSPGEGSFEDNCECEKCGKIFSVKAN
jgi:hypothetical protein